MPGYIRLHSPVHGGTLAYVCKDKTAFPCMKTAYYYDWGQKTPPWWHTLRCHANITAVFSGHYQNLWARKLLKMHGSACNCILSVDYTMRAQILQNGAMAERKQVLRVLALAAL